MSVKTIPWQVWIAAGLALVVVTQVKRARQAAAAVGEAVNPTSDQNLAYKGVNALGDVADDGQNNDSFSLGSWLYDLTHPNEAERLGLTSTDDTKTALRQSEGIAE